MKVKRGDVKINADTTKLLLSRLCMTLKYNRFATKIENNADNIIIKNVFLFFRRLCMSFATTFCLCLKMNPMSVQTKNVLADKNSNVYGSTSI
jgi:hypothetical protein